MMLTDVDQFRTMVRDERKRRGMSQETFAGLTGMSRKWVSDFETGRVDPPLSAAFQAMRVLGFALEATPPRDELDDSMETAF